MQHLQRFHERFQRIDARHAEAIEYHRKAHHIRNDDTQPLYALVEDHEAQGNIDRAREIASMTDAIPVGILYRNPKVPCYEDLRETSHLRTTEFVKAGLEAEFDKFTVWPSQ